jgi:hypothetical protein
MKKKRRKNLFRSNEKNGFFLFINIEIVILKSL